MTTAGGFGPYQVRALVSISGTVYLRLSCACQRLRQRFGISIDEEELLDYLCEKAFERMGEWVQEDSDEKK